MEALKIRNVAKRFGTTQVLKDINIEIDAGEFLILVGRQDVASRPCSTVWPGWRM